MKKQDFKVLKTKDLYPFPDNPFHVAEDETLSELAESIKEFGIVTPIITRPKEDGDGYGASEKKSLLCHPDEVCWKAVPVPWHGSGCMFSD